MASFLSWFSGAGDAQATGDDLDSQLAAMNTRDYGPGGKFYSAGNWEAVKQNLSTGKTVNVDKEISNAFNEGLDEGAGNVTGFFSGIFDIFGKGIGALLKSIPWWIWLAVLVWVFWPYIAKKILATR